MNETGTEQQSRQPVSVVKLVIGVALGVLLAAAVIVGVYQANQPSDFDCAVQRAEYSMEKRTLYEVDTACR